MLEKISQRIRALEDALTHEIHTVNELIKQQQWHQTKIAHIQGAISELKALLEGGE